MQFGLGAINMYAVFVAGAGVLWALNLLIGLVCWAAIPFHLRLGCERRSYEWWMKFFERRDNSPWN
jgi:hypothetical protein